MEKYLKRNGDSWSEERAKEWYSSIAWCCGFNYLPAYAANSSEMWQEDSFDPEAIRRELAWASEWGYNSLRVFLPYVVWQENPLRFTERFGSFLEIANGVGISTVPVIFDDCAAFREKYLERWIVDGVGYSTDQMTESEKLSQWRNPTSGAQPDPVPGVHNSVWTPSPGSAVIDDPVEYPKLRNYVRELVSRFGRDERIIFWDLYNEPGNGSRYDGSVPLIKDAFAWCREVSPEQPLTVCVGFVYHECDRVAVDLSDIISFHSYSPKEKLIEQIGLFSEIERPKVLTEWMARTRGSTILSLLPFLKERSIGCWQWGLVDGKTQTKYPWGYSDEKSEPDPWFHDVMHPDGQPYDLKERDLVRSLTMQGERK